MAPTDTSCTVNPVIRGQLKDLPHDVLEATQRSHGLAEQIDFRPIDSVGTSLLVSWFMGSLALLAAALSVKSLLHAVGLLDATALHERILWFVAGTLMGCVAALTGRQAVRSTAHAKALKASPHRLGLFLSPSWLLVHRVADEVSFFPVAHIRSLEDQIVRAGTLGGPSSKVKLVYVVQTIDDASPPLRDPERTGSTVYLDCLSLPYIYDWWRAVQARRGADS